MKDDGGRCPNIQRVYHIERKLTHLVDIQLRWNGNSVGRRLVYGSWNSFTFGPQNQENVFAPIQLQFIQGDHLDVLIGTFRSWQIFSHWSSSLPKKESLWVISYQLLFAIIINICRYDLEVVAQAFQEFLDKFDAVDGHELQGAWWDFAYDRGQPTRILFIYNDSIDTDEHGCSQDAAKVLRIGNTIKKEYKQPTFFGGQPVIL